MQVLFDEGRSWPIDTTDALLPAFLSSDTWIVGAFALEQGFIFTSMILAAVVVYIVERKFVQGAAWCGVGALLSTLGLMHSYAWTAGDTVISMVPTWPWNNAWAVGYACMGLVLLLARRVTVPGESH